MAIAGGSRLEKAPQGTKVVARETDLLSWFCSAVDRIYSISQPLSKVVNDQLADVFIQHELEIDYGDFVTIRSKIGRANSANCAWPIG